MRYNIPFVVACKRQTAQASYLLRQNLAVLLKTETTADTPEQKEQEEEKKGGVLATYHDIRTGEKKEVKVGKEPFHELRYTDHNQSEAVAAIAAYCNKSSRGTSSFSCEIDPFVQTEAKLIQEPPFRPSISTKGRIKSVKHKLDKTGGYTTKIDCELFDKAQEDAAKNVTNTTPDKDDTLNPNAPPNACDEGDSVIHMDKEDRG